MDMRILIVGSGGREHAIASALGRSDRITLFAVMSRKNPGIAEYTKEIRIGDETGIPQILSFADDNAITHAIIGPEAPLQAGVVDALCEKGIRCIGPTRAAARIETDKAFCRDLMKRYAIPGCPDYRVFHDAASAEAFLRTQKSDYAIKPIGLTGGKGVRIMGEHVDLDTSIEYIRLLQDGVVIEERLIGEEFTLQAFCDGKTLIPMPLVQDHKRAFEGDTGPNTGGMGSYSLQTHTLPFVTQTDYKQALHIMQKIIDALAEEETPFRGILYGQFMNTSRGPMVIECNARFGDPEAMNVLTLLDSDPFDLVTAITGGTLDSCEVRFKELATVCKYLVPQGYPDNPQSGKPISIGHYYPASLYYANVGYKDREIVTASSRTLAFVGTGKTLAEAEIQAENAARSVDGEVWYRHDIGTDTVLQKRIAHLQEIR
ncbi:MAG: phosphoribosylamine--glycine ligase [Methanospirillaceae archaeon]|nr:phosphoribosylamine--glycine ligase [Methanospirillaceae archaeon]